MNRLCKIGDVVTSDRFRTWDPEEDGSYHLSEFPNNCANGNEWLVIKTEMTGGGNGHGLHDTYPDGYEVTVVMLFGNKLSNNKLKFYQNGCFMGIVEPKEINLIRKMKLKTTEIWTNV